MPSVSKVNIVNVALAKLGVARISSFDDDSHSARLAKDLYDLKRMEVLRAHPWDFALNRAELGKLEDDPPWGEFGNQFQVPSDSLRIVRMEDRTVRFKVEGTKLLTNLNKARVIYIRDETDTSLFDANFIDALATRIAAEFAMVLKQDRQGQANLYEAYKFIVQNARSYDSQQGTPDDVIIDGWLSARGGTGRPFGPGELT